MKDNPATEIAQVSDLSFDEYNQRQRYEASSGGNRQRAESVRPSGNFIYDGKNWEPQKYEGFAVVSMLDENPGNESLIARLKGVQKDLRQHLFPRNAFYQLPPASFHQTLANTLSTERFSHQILERGLEDIYPTIVAEAFKKIPPSPSHGPVRMSMTGLSIFGTAIGILGLFENQQDYERILNFRAGFYADSQLRKCDVKMTRPFIGHITLTYIEQNLDKSRQGHLAGVIKDINDSLALEENYFSITLAGLRRYRHLAEFLKHDNYPVYHF